MALFFGMNEQQQQVSWRDFEILRKARHFFGVPFLEGQIKGPGGGPGPEDEAEDVGGADHVAAPGTMGQGQGQCW